MSESEKDNINKLPHFSHTETVQQHDCVLGKRNRAKHASALTSEQQQEIERLKELLANAEAVLPNGKLQARNRELGHRGRRHRRTRAGPARPPGSHWRALSGDYADDRGVAGMMGIAQVLRPEPLADLSPDAWRIIALVLYWALVLWIYPPRWWRRWRNT